MFNFNCFIICLLPHLIRTGQHWFNALDRLCLDELRLNRSFCSAQQPTVARRCATGALLQINGKSTTSTVTSKLALDDPVPHKTARISPSPFSYTFQVDSGQKIIRLHFNPSQYKGFRGSKDLTSGLSGNFTLLSNFSASLVAVNTFAIEFCLIIQRNE